ncbi:MAG: phosphoribosylanthranilate isomerase [Dehalococcoidia bacterium]|nr:phosphoribosylanthranilate isomerase [Dehalococcoidia bacterium]MDD5493821.1 phosphoribosylanthranilate isomerase [Dehalococcoidia bacterium]
MTLIKICGLTGLEDALSVAQMGVDMAGLVFFTESRRRISFKQAAEIIAALGKLPRRPAIVGVFVNENAQTVNETAQTCGLDMVQLSGDEGWEYCRDLERPFIKVIHVLASTGAAEIVERINIGRSMNFKQPYLCMLDTMAGGLYGGSGQGFNREVARQVCATVPVLIAGGLSSDNVAELIQDVKPLGVDVSSGVETDGRKDMNKIRRFVEAVRAAEAPGGVWQSLPPKYYRKGEIDVT